jgi:eukaryotic-like serine/threonine-protein kinase
MSADRDEAVLDLLNQLTERFRAEGTIDPEEVLQQHPELADEVRALWGTILVAEDFGLPAEDAPAAVAGSPSSPTIAGSPEPADEFAGRRIGDYELLEEIGRGGMGRVYRARQVSLNRTVAVKMLLGGKVATPANLARFQSEAEAAGRLDHPHIVTVFEVGSEEGHPYFSMPFIDGTTLARRIADGPLPDREAAELLIPVCRAVAHAHRQGILHRDLKPSNILIDRPGRPFVSDFGLAKRFGEPRPGDPQSLTESGAILGTPGYMAPEQAAGTRRHLGGSRSGEVNQATDVYSLGAILYACLTGRAPFQAASPVDALLMILEQEPPPPRMLNPKIEPDLEMIIFKAMQKPADLRYESADALADDLEAWLRNDPVSARSSHFSQILSRAFRPTHHVSVLENWGLLWMWHAVVLLVLCLITNALKWSGVDSRLPYLGLWTVGLGTWAAIFWNLRHRSGPVTFVERQIAHVWAASMAGSTALFGVEFLLGLPVLTLSPVLALLAGGVFVVKAGILSGEFYLSAAIMFLTAIPMALLPDVALILFGIVSAGTFFVPGLKFYRLKRREE